MARSILFVLLFAFAPLAATSARTPEDRPVAIINVSVIPMDKERVLANQTVIVRGGMISAIGNAKTIKVPRNAQRIDGKDKFLIPGLTDMHVHLMSDEDEFPDGLAEDELKIMVANGVTTIRLMTGTPEQLVLRAKAARGEIISPTIYAASPQFIGKKSNNSAISKGFGRTKVTQGAREAQGFDEVH